MKYRDWLIKIPLIIKPLPIHQIKGFYNICLIYFFYDPILIAGTGIRGSRLLSIEVKTRVYNLVMTILV